MKLSVLLETSCLRDARRQAGIGRYTTQLMLALEQLDGLELATCGGPASPSQSRPVRFLVAQPAALAAARRRRPHVLHGVGGEPVMGFPAARQVVTVHDVELWRMPAPPGPRGAALRLHAALQARWLRQVAAVITPSRTSATEAIQTLGLDSARVHVIAHGVGAAFVPQVAPYDEIALTGAGVRAGNYVLWVGNLRHHDPRKGLDVILDAIESAGEKAPPLLLVGSAGEEADRIQQQARARRLRLSVCGPRSDTDLAALYRHASCSVIGSHHEGFGLTALEAMACGCAVVATAAGNVPDLLTSAGLIVATGDSAGLGSAIVDVSGEPERREAMRRSGLRRARQFRWDVAARQTTDVYRAVAEQAATIRHRPQR